MVVGSRSGSLNIDVRRRAQQSWIILVLQILHDAWPAAAADSRVTRCAGEDAISDVLRWKMVEAKNRLDPVPQLRFEREAQSDDHNIDNPLGLIDIKVLYTWNDETYLTMECKRITSTENSLARMYIRNGVNRFASGKYSPGHSFGIVTGYVMCGDPDLCADRVERQLQKEPVEVTGYDTDFGWQIDNEILKNFRHYRTRHQQAVCANTIELIHAFVLLD